MKTKVKGAPFSAKSYKSPENVKDCNYVSSLRSIRKTATFILGANKTNKITQTHCGGPGKQSVNFRCAGPSLPRKLSLTAAFAESLNSQMSDGKPATCKILR